jgi:hypothetical protein
MSDTNTCGPAYPQFVLSNRGAYVEGGMTLRQYAAIKLKVPDSGTYWLDDMIRKSLLDDFAAKAMQGICNGRSHVDLKNHAISISKVAYEIADAMLKAREAK